MEAESVVAEGSRGVNSIDPYCEAYIDGPFARYIQRKRQPRK